MPNDHEPLLTVEDRLEATESRCVVLLPLLDLRDTVRAEIVRTFVADTARDVRAIEAALHRTLWGRAALRSVAPDVPGGGRSR
jgi:hypothetical protein